MGDSPRSGQTSAYAVNNVLHVREQPSDLFSDDGLHVI